MRVLTDIFALKHPTERALASDWFVNSFIMVVFKKKYYLSSVRIFCPKYD